MGAGIALVAARAGYDTYCFDLSADGLARSRKAAQKFFGRSVEKGRMSQEDCDAALDRMTDTLSLIHI